MDPAEPPTLPTDPLLEIVKRSNDVTAIIRFAAASKPLRTAILDPGFRRRLGLRAAATSGFDPDLLVAVSHAPHGCYCHSRGLGSIVHPPSWRLRFDAERLLRSFNPASSREGLVVLRRIREAPSTVELLVCNTITGHATSLPEMNLPRFVEDRDPRPTLEIYRPAVMSIDGGGSSFELLVMYKPKHKSRGEAQIFSSQTGEWGAARMIHMPPGMDPVDASSTAPAIVGSSVHWICQYRHRANDMFILSLDAEAGAGHATATRLPQELLANLGSSCMSADKPAHSLILAATAGGTRLSLIVAERPLISLWTLLPDEGTGGSSWSREVVIRKREIGRQLNNALDAYQLIRFDVFGERSGTVLFWVRGAGLVQLNLGTKEALVLWKDSDDRKYHNAKAFLHEVDLVSLLKSMKTF